MAKDRKTHSPPSLSINAPKALSSLMEAFHVDSEETAKDLILQATKAIYARDRYSSDYREISKAELEAVTSLMKCLNPRDSLETLYSAQIVVSHLIGLRKLSKNCSDDQKLGLNFLRFSSESIQKLEKKRSGGSQNITVNYNYHGKEPENKPTIIPINEE